MIDPQQRLEPQGTPQRGNRAVIVLVAILVIVLLVGVYLATRGNADQDKLTGKNASSATARAANHEKLCASSTTYELMKRDLFRRAAELRGSDAATFDRISAVAVLRMENPVMESQDAATGGVNCSGSLALDLPPGVEVVGGRRTLASDVDYTVTTAADGSGPVVLLKNAEPIVTPLATLTQVNAPSAEQPQAADTNAVQPGASPPLAVPVAPDAPPRTVAIKPPMQPQPPAARPSFNCSTARTRGELAVCSDPGLAALDRQMASQYARAVDTASPDERQILRETAHRFYAYRDRCPDNGCIGDAYTDRMREIRDIVDGRWQPSQ